ncbi:hypothetical protein Trydic_g7353 [Trypoxylus dichotomus]
MGAITFDKLYDNYNTLSDAKEKITQHSQEYLEAIEGTKGDEKEKKLAAQIISKFFKHFPSLQSQAIEAIFDICEDDETSIRIAAMKTLPSLCKENKEHIEKIADILAQLLQLDDPQEYNTASNALLQILNEDPITVIKCIFKQIHGADANVGEKCIKFMVTKVKPSDKMTSEVEDFIISECKKVLQDATADEFILLMPYLSTTKVASTITGQQELINLVLEQLELDVEFDVLDKENNNNVDKLVTCIKFILPFFSTKIESTKLVVYICDHVLPHWEAIKELPQGNLYQLALLRQLAELSTYCGKLDNPSLHVVQIFDKLKIYMPPPPEDTSTVTIPHLEFSFVESLLYAFHRLARQCQDFLTHDAQGCSRALNNLDKEKVYTAEEIKAQQISPKLFNNINSLIKDLFYQTPMYKCNVVLSFKTEDSSVSKKLIESSTTTQKRHVPITFESNGSAATKQSRSNRSGDNIKLYTPPSGKFSNSFQNYDKSRGRFGGRGRGSRGRGSGRGWRN